MPIKRAEAAYAPRANPVDPAALKKEGKVLLKDDKESTKVWSADLHQLVA